MLNQRSESESGCVESISRRKRTIRGAVVPLVQSTVADAESVSLYIVDTDVLTLLFRCIVWLEVIRDGKPQVDGTDPFCAGPAGRFLPSATSLFLPSRHFLCSAYFS